MKKALMVAMAAVIGNVTAEVAGAADAAGVERTVTVCMAAHVERITLEAERVASNIFHGLGVRVHWRNDARSCGNSKDGAIIVSYSLHTPQDKLPGALAMALPYEGTRIEIFYDRVLDPEFAVDPAGYLGHVLAHEITHILQGFTRHAPTGVMKANWTRADRAQMNNRHMLAFTRDDVDLIHAGLRARQASVISAAQTDEIK